MLLGLQARNHKVEKVYTCGEAADDLMLHGTVRWTFKDGGKLDGPFAARAVVDQSGDRPRLKLYQGWAVSCIFLGIRPWLWPTKLRPSALNADWL